MLQSFLLLLLVIFCGTVQAKPYTIKAGDTIGSIIKSDGCVTEEELLRANPGLESRALRLKDHITIPLILPAEHDTVVEERDATNRTLLRAETRIRNLEADAVRAIKKAEEQIGAIEKLTADVAQLESRGVLFRLIGVWCVLLVGGSAYLGYMVWQQQVELKKHHAAIQKLKSDLEAARERISDKLKSAGVVAHLKPEELALYTDLVIDLNKLGTRIPEIRRRIERFITEQTTPKLPPPALTVVPPRS